MEEGSSNNGFVEADEAQPNEIASQERSNEFEADDIPVISKDKDSEEDDDHPKCGWFGIRPRFLQLFNRPAGFLIVILIYALAQSTTVNGLVYIVTTTLERRFNLTSARSGSISSMYDLSVLIVIVFVTYFGERSHKPVWLGRGAFIFGLGSFLFTLPHFLTENYTYGSEQGEITCNTTREPIDQCPEGTDEKNLSNYYYVFVAAQILHGIGASPLYTLGQTYIYDNTRPRQVPVFLGIFQIGPNFAPAIGFIGGGLFLTLYTDLRVSDEQTIDPSSPLWVGNWWLGFICTGTIAILASIPLSGFPRRLPGTKNIEDERKYVAQSGSGFKPSGFGAIDKLRDFPRAVFNLLKNLPCLCNYLGTASEYFIIACISVFGPKFVESQFSLTAAEAALFAGLVVMPSAILGVLLGGFLVKWFNWGYKGRMRFTMSMLFVGWAMMMCMLIRCPNIPFAGVTVKYDNTSHRLAVGESDLDNVCNANCQCGTEYDPVCGSNNVQYYTGCHAGCVEVDTSGDSKLFSNCSCVTDPVFEVEWQAEQGRCNQDCDLQNLFFFMVFMALFVAFSTIVPTLTSLLSVVDVNQRTLSLGLQSLFMRCLGTVPAPIIFGKLIDNACMIWETECEGQKTCWVYQNDDFARAMFLVVFISRAFSICFFSGMLIFYKPKQEDEMELSEKEIPPPSEIDDIPSATDKGGDTAEKGDDTAEHGDYLREGAVDLID